MKRHWLHLSICLLAFLGLCVASASTHAFTEDELTPEELEKLMAEWKPLEVTGDAIPWPKFAETTETEICETDEEGFDYCYVEPGYPEDILKLDGTHVTLMGFMFPLDQSEKQKNFLLGPYPLSCPFHYHVGPSQMVEVLADKAVTFSYEPVTVKGILRVRYNKETEVFFYLENAS